MDPNEIVKNVSGLLETGAIISGALKLTDVGKAILGPATAEFAERVHDAVRLYRFGRQVKALEKAEKMVKDAGFAPKAVPLNLLFPLLEGASLEEDEDLHTMWAALLANSSRGSDREVRVCFCDILKQLSPCDAKLLMRLADAAWEYTEDRSVERGIRGLDEPIWTTLRLLGESQETGVTVVRNMPHYDEPIVDVTGAAASADNLIRLRLMYVTDSKPFFNALGFDSTKGLDGGEKRYGITVLGLFFIAACSPPDETS